jgi:class II lanthipeptide synthase
MGSDTSGFLDVAAALARQLAGSAMWYRRRCSWIGASSSEPRDNRIAAALGPDLYGGTSGVALALAEAAVTLGDDCARDTALGAVRHALRHADPSLDGLYGGAPGVAYAAARVAGLLGDEHGLQGARALIRAWRGSRTPASAFDLVEGRAGTVLALLALDAAVDEPWLREAATAVGDELLAQAEVTPFGWSWPTPGEPRMHHLCGFAHGAAGAGLALLELFAITGDERFRQAGEGAFEYERSWTDSSRQAVPDLRGVGRAVSRDAPVPAAVSWCHVAAGVALARLRADELLGSAGEQPDVALGATREFVSERLDTVPDDFCLCHGLGGAADMLLYANHEAALAMDVGRLGIERHHLTGGGFPSGLPEGTTPGLLAGLAGIALFYLRLGDRNIQTPLLIKRVDRASGAA